MPTQRLLPSHAIKTRAIPIEMPGTFVQIRAKRFAQCKHYTPLHSWPCHTMTHTLVHSHTPPIHMIIEKLVFLTNFYCESEFRLCVLFSGDNGGGVFAISCFCCFCWAFMHNFVVPTSWPGLTESVTVTVTVCCCSCCCHSVQKASFALWAEIHWKTKDLGNKLERDCDVDCDDSPEPNSTELPCDSLRPLRCCS